MFSLSLMMCSAVDFDYHLGHGVLADEGMINASGCEICPVPGNSSNDRIKHVHTNRVIPHCIVVLSVSLNFVKHDDRSEHSYIQYNKIVRRVVAGYRMYANSM